VGTRSRLGTWSGLGPPATAQAPPLGLLVASRSSSLRMAVALGALLAIRAIRRRQSRHEGWQAPNHAMETIVRNTKQWLVWAALTALLVVAATYCVSVWQATPSMPFYRNIILGGAIVLMLVFGCGLIALMFYSRRKGYDEPPRSNRIQRE
jgi:hypothetical protein